MECSLCGKEEQTRKKFEDVVVDLKLEYIFREYNSLASAWKCYGGIAMYREYSGICQNTSYLKADPKPCYPCLYKLVLFIKGVFDMTSVVENSVVLTKSSSEACRSPTQDSTIPSAQGSTESSQKRESAHKVPEETVRGQHSPAKQAVGESTHGQANKRSSLKSNGRKDEPRFERWCLSPSSKKSVIQAKAATQEKFKKENPKKKVSKTPLVSSRPRRPQGRSLSGRRPDFVDFNGDDSPSATAANRDAAENGHNLEDPSSAIQQSGSTSEPTSTVARSTASASASASAPPPAETPKKSSPTTLSTASKDVDATATSSKGKLQTPSLKKSRNNLLGDKSKSRLSQASIKRKAEDSVSEEDIGVSTKRIRTPTARLLESNLNKILKSQQTKKPEDGEPESPAKRSTDDIQSKGNESSKCSNNRITPTKNPPLSDNAGQDDNSATKGDKWKRPGFRNRQVERLDRALEDGGWNQSIRSSANMEKEVFEKANCETDYVAGISRIVNRFRTSITFQNGATLPKASVKKDELANGSKKSPVSALQKENSPVTPAAKKKSKVVKNVVKPQQPGVVHKKKPGLKPLLKPKGKRKVIHNIGHVVHTVGNGNFGGMAGPGAHKARIICTECGILTTLEKLGSHLKIEHNMEENEDPRLSQLSSSGRSSPSVARVPYIMKTSKTGKRGKRFLEPHESLEELEAPRNGSSDAKGRRISTNGESSTNARAGSGQVSPDSEFINGLKLTANKSELRPSIVSLANGQNGNTFPTSEATTYKPNENASKSVITIDLVA